MLEDKTCCFFGHRGTKATDELKIRLYETIERLIKEKGVNKFLFGSKSGFNDICYEIVTRIKQKYPHIERIYVRAEYLNINDDYRNYLLERYEDTYYPERIVGSGRAVYVERNYEMINRSRFCVIYCNTESAPINRKSGTEAALDYALKQGREVIIIHTL